VYLIWLLCALWEGTFGEKRDTDRFFAHRAWLVVTMSDAEFIRVGGYAAKRYVAEYPRASFRAPPAFGFRSRPFN